MVNEYYSTDGYNASSMILQYNTGYLNTNKHETDTETKTIALQLSMWCSAQHILLQYFLISDTKLKTKLLQCLWLDVAKCKINYYSTIKHVNFRAGNGQITTSADVSTSIVHLAVPNFQHADQCPGGSDMEFVNFNLSQAVWCQFDPVLKPVQIIRRIQNAGRVAHQVNAITLFHELCTGYGNSCKRNLRHRVFVERWVMKLFILELSLLTEYLLDWARKFHTKETVLKSWSEKNCCLLWEPVFRSWKVFC